MFHSPYFYKRNNTCWKLRRSKHESELFGNYRNIRKCRYINNSKRVTRSLTRSPTRTRIQLDVSGFPYIIYVYVYESYITIYTFKKLINKENTKKNHKRVVSVYVIQIHVDIHKL